MTLMQQHLLIVFALALLMYAIATITHIVRDCWLQRARHKLRQEIRDAHERHREHSDYSGPAMDVDRRDDRDCRLVDRAAVESNAGTSEEMRKPS